MQTFLISTGIVALGEMGDKTQLLAMMLAAKFKRPVPIIVGIFVATLANHALAGALGGWVTTALGPDVLRWVVGLSFLAMAVWMLFPDRVDDDAAGAAYRFGVFGTTVIAFFIAEMGDKTQLLAMMLAAKFKRPVPIIVGIFVATLANHALAGAVGGWVTTTLGPDVLRWVIGLSFLAMAVWMLIPDRIDDETTGTGHRFGVFGTTVIAFFIAEMGDKTQIATVALAARFNELVAVVAGTTLGMMLANVPAVFLGDTIAKKVSMPLVHGIAAMIFAGLGLITLLNAGPLF